MGNEQSLLNDSYLGDEINDSKCLWPRSNGEILSTGRNITIFFDKGGDKQSKYFVDNSKWIKCLRHPSILKFISDGKSSECRYLVTERVDPLAVSLENLSSVEICSGLYSVLQALEFMHKKALACHNNICIDSIYVTEHGQWKLGDMQHACRFNDFTEEYMRKSHSERKENCIPPEEKSDVKSKVSTAGYARDMYAFGVLYEDLQDYIEDLGDLTKTFELRIQDECLNPDPNHRPEASDLMDDVLFKNEFLVVSKFLKDITLKSEEEKKDFFMNLIPKLVELEENLIAHSLSHLLLCRFVLLDAHARKYVIPQVLTPRGDNVESKQGLFSQNIFKTYIIPEVIRMFHCHDYLIRMVLLNYFTEFVFLFDTEDLQHIILPQLLLGLRDQNEDLAGQSLRCLADLVPILGRDIVIGGKSKPYFTKGTPKLCVNGEPKEDMDSVNHIMRKPLLKDLVANSSKYVGFAKEEGDYGNKTMNVAEAVKTIKSLKSEEKKLNPKKALKKVHFSKLNEEIHEAIIEESVNHEEEQIEHCVNNISTILNGAGLSVESSHADDDENWQGWDDDDVGFSVDSMNSDDDLTKRKDETSEKIQSSVHSSEVLITENSIQNVDSNWKTFDITDSEKNIPSPKHKGTSKKLTLKSKKPSKPKTENLGSEFEIKSIEIKNLESGAGNFDFFSDMAPDIQSTLQPVGKEIDLPSTSDLSYKESGPTVKRDGTTSLAYTPELTGSEEVTDGWDDANWEGF